MKQQAEHKSVILVLGGARSGKSTLAETLTESLATQRLYVATAQARDGEMADRIATHQARRKTGWHTCEEPTDLTGALDTAKGRAVLVDCLTLWLSNLMEENADIDARTAELVAQLDRHEGPVVMVSNEIGLGLVPDTPLGRRFRDAQGRLNQTVAAAAGTVVFVAAGLPLVLKGALP